MNLIMWRHADAGDSLQDLEDDLERSLSERGKKQASRMSRWLEARLPESFAVVSSPAQRALQTAVTLSSKVRPEPRLLPGASLEEALQAIKIDEAHMRKSGHLVVVGHQPLLGQLLSHLVSGKETCWSIKKGA
ncbi:MAG: histidine phosphatase family protein, partial [Betaproteobacteria bacterium]|nr:histidine phosphatase family protein [Betaproteobacteria bacterium]